MGDAWRQWWRYPYAWASPARVAVLAALAGAGAVSALTLSGAWQLIPPIAVWLVADGALGLARSRYVHEREIPLPKASQALRTRSTLGATLVILFFPAIAVLVTINLDWKVGWAWTLLAAGLLVYQLRVRLKFLKRGQLGDPRWARDWSPETDPAHAYRGVFQLQRGNYEEARALLQQALESNPGDQSTLYNLACVEARVGQREAAITHLLGALSGNERLLKHAQKDADLAPIRDDPRFPR